MESMQATQLNSLGFSPKSLRKISSISCGGTALNFIAPKTVDSYHSILRLLTQARVDFIVIGSLSNTLFREGDIHTPIISTMCLTSFSVRTSFVDVEPGMLLARLVALFCRYGDSSLVDLSGIPGTVAGAIVNNSGAYGTLLSSRLLQISLMESTNNLSTTVMTYDDMNYSYRSSALKDKKTSFGILSVRLLMIPDSRCVDSSLQRLATSAKRRAIEQYCPFPNLGSVLATADLSTHVRPLWKSYFLKFISYTLGFLCSLRLKIDKRFIYHAAFLFIFSKQLSVKTRESLSPHNQNVIFNSLGNPDLVQYALSELSLIAPSLQVEWNLYLSIL